MIIPTPLVPVSLNDEGRAVKEIYAKIEYLHPSGSMKHRSIPQFLQALQESGELRPQQCIAIRSAGSAAVTTAWAGAQLGIPVTAVLPPTAMPQTILMLEWLGATCHQVPSDVATQMMQQFAQDPDVYVLAQAREARLIDHYRPVAREIIVELGTAVSLTVGIGTGLSATGLGREIKSTQSPGRVYGVEPAEAAIASGQPWAPHGVPGLAPPIPQPLLDKSLLSDILAIPSAAAWHYARQVAQTSGLLLGPSSGLTIAAAVQLRRQGISGPIVAICACSINDYLETSKDWLN